jgi:hypothetical protein
MTFELAAEFSEKRRPDLVESGTGLRPGRQQIDVQGKGSYLAVGGKWVPEPVNSGTGLRPGRQQSDLH